MSFKNLRDKKNLGDKQHTSKKHMGETLNLILKEIRKEKPAKLMIQAQHCCDTRGRQKHGKKRKLQAMSQMNREARFSPQGLEKQI